MDKKITISKPVVYKGTTILLTAGFLLYGGNTSIKILDSIHAEAAENTVYTTTSNVNLRSGASTKEKIILTIPKNSSITYISKSGSWYKVIYKSKTGWVQSDYVKSINKTTSVTNTNGILTSYQTTANLNLRSSSSTNASILATIPKGKPVTYISKKNSWYQVKYGNKTGWVSSAYLKASTSPSKPASPAPSKPAAADKVVTYQTTDNLNLRSKASTTGSILTTIPKGRTVTYLAKNGSWYQVKYGNKTGWVSSAYLKASTSPSKPASPAPSKPAAADKVVTYQTTDNLNLRSKASTAGSILTTIPKGKTVTYLAKSGSWYQVKYGNKTGWVSSTYLKTSTSPSKPASSAPSKPAAADKVVTYQTTDNLNLRSKASTAGSILTTIPKGKTITYLAKSGSWYQVKYGNKKGWVSSAYLKNSNVAAKPVKDEANSSIVNKSYQTTANLNLRSEATTQGTLLLTIPKGELVKYLDKSSFWYKVQYRSVKGWVSSEFLKDVPANNKEAESETAYYHTISNLNLRMKASTTAAILVTIPKNSTITYITKDGNWYKVNYNGFTGWVSADFVQKGKAQNMANNSDQKNQDGYITLDLRTKSSVTAQQINEYIAKNASISNSVLFNQGQTIINAANKYGVNALYLASHAIHESNYGKSTISMAKYNLFGYGAYDKAPFVGAVKFPSIQSNIEFIAQMMKATYLNEDYWTYKGPFLGYTVKDANGTRIDSQSAGMNYYYASDSNWGNAIANHMAGILNYSNENAKNEKPNTAVPSRPSYPDEKDIFPAGVIAVAHKAITLNEMGTSSNTTLQTTANLNLRYTASTSSNILATIPKNTSLSILDKNSGWYKVNYGSKTGWVSETYVKAANSSKETTIPAGAIFYLLEKSNNEQLTVQYNGKIYGLNSVQLSNYNAYMSVKNLARVNASSLNVRSDANQSASVIATLTNYSYVTLAVDNQKNPIINNGWYKIQLANGKTGWAFGTYLIRELNR